MPKDKEYYLFDADLERLEPHLEKATELIPILKNYGIKTVVNGPTIWAADGNPLVGPTHKKG